MFLGTGHFDCRKIYAPVVIGTFSFVAQGILLKINLCTSSYWNIQFCGTGHFVEDKSMYQCLLVH